MTSSQPDDDLERMHTEWRQQRLADLARHTPAAFADRIELPAAALDWLASAGHGQGKNLVLHGDVGTGKTHMSWELARRYLARVPARVEILTSSQMVRSFRGDSCDPTIDRLQSAHLLVLDDVGASALTPWVDDALFAVIDHRYAWRRPTVVTTNLSDLRVALGERMASRLAQDAIAVPVVGADRRRQQ